jgi:predicted exporter
MGSTTNACGEDDSQQQHPQQQSSSHKASAYALAFTYKSIGSIELLSTLSLIWIIILFLFSENSFRHF